jgi:hypothetical protein
VALTEHNHAMMSTFFANLERFTQEKIVKLNAAHAPSRSRSNSLSALDTASPDATNTGKATTARDGKSWFNHDLINPFVID